MEVDLMFKSCSRCIWECGCDEGVCGYYSPISDILLEEDYFTRLLINTVEYSKEIMSEDFYD